ncbi:hypothetical protein [Caldimonas brevitalea]|uniref:hypothetical protein n=1 Tax=Caldimonas brevitalea TaxID=413882 RepID=UPI0012FAADA0|nr:hypothetical protein [Caldimonas brevitalea]
MQALEAERASLEKAVIDGLAAVDPQFLAKVEGQAIGAELAAEQARYRAQLTADLIRGLVDVAVEAGLLRLKLEQTAQSVTAPPKEPYLVEADTDSRAALSASDLGRALGGLSDETVRQRERAGELFSILRPGRKRGREYPAFQAWTGIAGEPLNRVLAALGRPNGPSAYLFFTSPIDLLGGLTPIEALLGRLPLARDLEPEAADLLGRTAEERLSSVLRAAEAEAATGAA